MNIPRSHGHNTAIETLTLFFRNQTCFGNLTTHHISVIRISGFPLSKDLIIIQRAYLFASTCMFVIRAATRALCRMHTFASGKYHKISAKTPRSSLKDTQHAAYLILSPLQASAILVTMLSRKAVLADRPRTSQHCLCQSKPFASEKTVRMLIMPRHCG